MGYSFRSRILSNWMLAQMPGKRQLLLLLDRAVPHRDGNPMDYKFTHFTHLKLVQKEGASYCHNGWHNDQYSRHRHWLSTPYDLYI